MIVSLLGKAGKQECMSALFVSTLITLGIILISLSYWNLRKLEQINRTVFTL